MRNKNQLQSGIKPPRELMLFIWPFIATLLYTLPEFLATTTKKLALQFDGYDNVVHFGILSKILSCESFIDKCQHDSKSPLDSYPQSWHSFFASFSQHYEQKPSELLSLYVLYKASSFLLSLILLSYAIVTIEERRRSDATRFRFISKCLIYIMKFLLRW